MFKIRMIILIGLFLVMSCGKASITDKVFIEKALPGDVGINSKILDELVSDIESGKIHNVHGVMLIKDDKLVHEKYFAGHGSNELHYVASVTKSFASTLLGIAIDQGYFGDDIHTVLNRKIADLFPVYAEIINRDSLKNELKLHHILTMTAGFEWDEHTFPYTDSRNDCNRINNNIDPMRFLFERDIIHTPGTNFYYNGGLSLSISYLIESYTGMSVLEFAKINLFDPLDIVDYRWTEVENGLIDTDGGLHLRLKDQAKLGYLFLNKGSWYGRQIVSEYWVRESTKLHIDNYNQPDYGYQWWGGNFNAMDRTFAIYFASGHGGQKVAVIPEFNTVFILNQQVFNNPYGHLNIIAILSEYILPALVGQRTIQEPEKFEAIDLEEFCGRYISEVNDDFIDVTKIDNALVLSSNNGDTNVFTPISGTTFSSRIMDILNVKIEFKMDEAGKIKYLHSMFGFRNLKFEKTDN
ncbi:serine hydrolase [bacterium]|nr:serine hydrolase [bacterium]